jgi:transposase InsO family protein
MDFIPELPMTKSGHNNILVIVDKLTKYGIFIPTTTKINEIKVAKLLFHHIISKYGIPKQMISDRDSKFTGRLWGELCKLIGAKRSLTTSYHPQADGQTEILNQTLEIALRCYVNPTRDDWDEYLDPFSLAYNSSYHSSTGYAPAFLLMGYQPKTEIGVPESEADYIRRPETDVGPSGDSDKQEQIRTSTFHHVDLFRDNELAASQLVESFQALRNQARDSITFAQHRQARNYNKGRLDITFKAGDLVL